MEWISVNDRLPEQKRESISVCDGLISVCHNEYHDVSNLVLVAVVNDVGKRFVGDDVLVDGEWVNYPFPEFDITHWMPLPSPPGEETP